VQSFNFLVPKALAVSVDFHIRDCSEVVLFRSWIVRKWCRAVVMSVLCETIQFLFC